MTLTCLVIDDKPLAVEILTEYINKTPFLELAASTTSSIEGLMLLRQQNIKLVFLDIQMPELTGMDFIKIAGKDCRVILTTAYPDYALDGYEHDVVDYLLKPISYDRFYRAAEKAFRMLDSNRLDINGITSPQNNPPEYIFVKTEHRIIKINTADILYIESLQNYISIFTGNERIMSLQTLKKTEDQLPAKEFVRVHKSYIVALRHIKAIERSRIFIGDDIIPIGDNYRSAFFRMIENS